MWWTNSQWFKPFLVYILNTCSYKYKITCYQHHSLYEAKLSCEYHSLMYSLQRFWNYHHNYITMTTLQYPYFFLISVYITEYIFVTGLSLYSSQNKVLVSKFPVQKIMELFRNKWRVCWLWRHFYYVHSTINTVTR